MNDLFADEIKNSIGKTVILFLRNGFRYHGEVLDADDIFLKLRDFKSGTELIKIDAIQQMRVVQGGSE